MAAAQAQRDEDQAFAHQEEAVLRMRGMLEDESSQRKANFAKQMMEENKEMARQKRAREQAWKEDQESNNQFEVTLTNHNEILDPNGATRRTDNHQ